MPNWPGFTLEYNDVTLSEVNILGYERAAVLHGPDYLYHKHLFRIQGVFNPGMDGDNTAFPDETEQLLEKRLSYPRQNLKITSIKDGEEVTWLEVIGPDVDLGPKTIYCNVVHFNGLKTYHVDWVFETSVVDDKRDTILSCRWSSTHTMDGRFWTNISVSGEAVLRGDTSKLAVGEIGYDADLIRNKLILPCPLGFKRQNLSVTHSQDGLGVQFSFLDSQVPIANYHSEIADINHAWSVVVTRAKADQALFDGAGLVQAGLQAAEQAIIAKSFATGGGRKKSERIRGQAAGAISAASGLMGLAMDIGAAVDRNLPQCKVMSTTTVYGLPSASMFVLYDEAARYSMRRVANIPYSTQAWTITNCALQGDVRQRTVNVAVVLERSNIASFIPRQATLRAASLVGVGAAAIFSNPNTTAWELAACLTDPGLEDDTGFRGEGTTDTANLAKTLPNDSGTRGDTAFGQPMIRIQGTEIIFAALQDGP